jgi:Ca2+-binding EF-hand superfamily protein
LKEEEYQALAENFTEEGPQIIEPQVVNYAKFCAVVDEVYAEGGPSVPQMSSSPSSTLLKTFVPNNVEDEERLMNVLHRVAALCQSRRVSIKECFTDNDRAAIASPSRPNPRRGGKVTKPQFLRLFPFHKEVSSADLEVLAERYKTECGNIHFMALHNDVVEYGYNEPQPFPTSHLILRPDEAEWYHKKLDPVAKLRSKVVERRIRISEHFQDFDPLRKGCCTPGQLKTVFTIMHIAKEVTREEFDAISNRYLRDDGMFCYRDFCADIDKDFTTPHLEKTPLKTLSMPDFNTTAPARRNKMSISEGRRRALTELEDKMRYRVRTRGMLLKPTFKDMDKTNNGYITRGQFERAMDMLGFGLDEASLGLLYTQYCDQGNHVDVNYLNFMKSVDPPLEHHELAMQQQQAPYKGFQPAKYFDHKGGMVGRGSSVPVRAV